LRIHPQTMQVLILVQRNDKLLGIIISCVRTFFINLCGTVVVVVVRLKQVYDDTNF